ncbi:ATP-binding protein [Actinoplanes solisilvae]|uniref:ATP-binding protein n=1 Tax=Actinoplanes solisilvae TaxID=2486853 RepID=UPI000FD72C50|nr:LuxR family transcriptional regulator [Actinoplanes solisilvae]
MTVIDKIPVPAHGPDPVGAVTLRGRESALALIDRRLADLRDGHGNVLLLDGGPGIGKTRLLDELRSRTNRAGLPVLRAEAVDGQQNVRFALLVAAVFGAQPPITEVQHVRDADRRGDLGYWLVHELTEGLRRASTRTPLVVILDGLQWADSATTNAIRAISAGLRNSAVLWALAARRDQAGDGLRKLFTELADGGADTVSLGGIRAAAVPALIEDVVRTAATPRLLGLAEPADGHPFWLIQLLCGLREEDCLHGTRGPATLPRRITRLMQERLEALTPQARRLVRMAAVMPPRFTADHLAGLTDSHATELIEPLDEAIRAGLLAVDGARLRFQPELLRHATRETMPVSLRRALDREAAEVLLRAGENPVEVAAGVAETAEVGDRPAASVLRAAARALAASDSGAAADLCVRAVDLLTADDAERGPTAAEAAELLHRAHRVSEAELLADRVIAGPLTTGSEAELRLTMSTMASRPLTDRIRENHLALNLTGIDRSTRRRHHVQLAQNLLLAGDHESAYRLARRTLAGTQETGDPEPDGAARLVLVATHIARGDASTASTELSGLLGSGPPLALGADNVLTAALWHCLGCDEEGGTVLKDCLGQARRERNSPLLALTTHIRAQAGLIAGRLTDARADLDSIDPDHEQGWALVLRMVTAAGLAVHLGDRDLGRAATAAAKRLRSADGPSERRWAGRVLAMSAAQRDDMAYACRLLAQDSLVPGAPPVPYDMSFLVAAARIAVSARDRDLLERVTTAAAAHTGNSAAPAFAVGADHVVRLVDGDAAGLLAVADRHSGSRPLLAAAATEDAGRILVEDGSTAAGLEQLNRAFDAYAAAGAVADAQRLQQMLRRHGTHRRVMKRRPSSGWDSLTEAELGVVRIVATGSTNREVAERLFLSPHTVNAHLRNAYAKLGIASRVRLANMLRDYDG